MYSIGVDVGGTGVQAGIVDEQGNIIYRNECITDVEGGFEKIVQDISSMINELIKNSSIDKKEIKSIGFGIPGYINKENKVNCINLKWYEVDFIDELKKYFLDFDIFVANDATVAALAESKFGSMKNHDIAVLITLGTGLGGGIIINGKPFVGAHGVGSEIGHMIIESNFYNCNCGNNGCFETFCSATAIIKHTQQILLESDVEMIYRSAIIDMCKEDISKINARMVFDAYREGDYFAKKSIKRFKSYLSVGLANIVNILDPDIIAIGGGMSKSSDVILEGLKEMIASKVLNKNEEFADIVIASLGNDAGIIGASSLN